MARPAARSLTRLAIVLTVLAVALFAASAASAARSEFFGIAQGTLDDQDVQAMEAAKVHTERFMLKWRSMEPSRGSYDWAERDHYIGRLAAHGIRSVPFVWGSPQWVGSGMLAQPPISSDADKQAWRNFLKAAVARYGPGGSYWTTDYPEQFPGAAPLPIQSWQIWNEPNLKKFFSPGQNVQQSAQKYATLLQISHDAIKSGDPLARIVLAGMPAIGDSKAWVFLDNMYQVPGIKTDFDAAALHPYSCGLDGVRSEMLQFRAAMTNHADGATPLWVTEFAWGSGPPDRFCKNKGLTGQQQLLSSSFKLFLSRRTEWNLQRVYWFLWRDPATGSGGASLCSICGTAGLLRFNRTPKPAYNTFRSFTAETTPPQATITSGPNGPTKDATPTFSFSSTEAGSTFQCRVDAQAFFPCPSPFTRGSPLANGAHRFFVKAIDAPGNESAVRSRPFTVDTVAPPTPQITATVPGSPANNNNPKVKGSAQGAVKLYKTASCTGAPAASGSGIQFASPGITAAVADNTTTSFRARAVDAAGNASACSAPRTYVEDSTAPQTTVTTGPGATTNDTTPTFTFTSSESGSTFQCRFDAEAFAACSGPGASHTRSTPLSNGSHTFEVRATDRAKNIDATPAKRTFTVTP